ncbi:hypothetical protein NQ317_012654 [Molorchus minor]|uniref:Uncharacterized protein n=1 Tax=Molorchus minor TaxID=1323400 RepID=A0ABQ9IS55_9CUCU|nr:hypothetical protein NQ317_012654 [Molorchus minor]
MNLIYHLPKHFQEQILSYRMSSPYLITGYLEPEERRKILLEYYALILESFFQPIAITPETTDEVVTSACILDSKVLAPNEQNMDDSHLLLPTKNLLPLTGNMVRARQPPTEIRDTFRTYFNGVDILFQFNSKLTKSNKFTSPRWIKTLHALSPTAIAPAAKMTVPLYCVAASDLPGLSPESPAVCTTHSGDSRAIRNNFNTYSVFGFGL